MNDDVCGYTDGGIHGISMWYSWDIHGGIHGIQNGMFMECDIHIIHGIDW